MAAGAGVQITVIDLPRPVNTFERFNEDGVINLECETYSGHWPQCLACKKQGEENHMNSKGHRSGMWRWSDTDWDNKIAISLESISRRGARLAPAGKRELLSVIYHGRNPDAYLAMERSWGSFNDNGILPPRPRWFETIGAQHPMHLRQPVVQTALEDTEWAFEDMGAGRGAQDHAPTAEQLLQLGQRVTTLEYQFQTMTVASSTIQSDLAKKIECLENELEESKSKIANLQKQLDSKYQ